MLLSYFKKTFVVMFLFLATAAMAKAQDPSAISSALKSGNAKAIAQEFDKRVVIAVDGQSNSYSKEQAEIILRNFLSKWQPKNFVILHKGISQGNAQYMVGNLHTTAGVFRTSIYMNNQSIQEIRFEKND